MAFSTNGGGVMSRRGGRRGGPGALAEMNVVPLVDVVLVLLIIFMLTAQVMEFGLEVDVPKVKQRETSAKELPVITIDSRGDYQLNDKAVNINSIGDEVRKRFPGSDAVYLRADKSVTWDVLAQMVSALKDANLKINMVTKAEEITPKGR
jgi:biopolymer transport protein ExbD